ncbi:unnamed protein product [Schistosoma turkestanicum]|nr:unnamed protein product [Schistosoma turkestanicum]
MTFRWLFIREFQNLLSFRLFYSDIYCDSSVLELVSKFVCNKSRIWLKFLICNCCVDNLIGSHYLHFILLTILTYFDLIQDGWIDISREIYRLILSWNNSMVSVEIL